MTRISGFESSKPGPIYFQVKCLIVTSIFSSQIWQVFFFLCGTQHYVCRQLNFVLNSEYPFEGMMKLSWTLLQHAHTCLRISTKHDYWKQPAGVTCTQAVKCKHQRGWWEKHGAPFDRVSQALKDLSCFIIKLILI